MITGKTLDISEYLDFYFYNLVWYWHMQNPSLSEHDCEIARWMGVAHQVGSNICYWLMSVSRVPVANSLVQHVMAEDQQNPQIMEQVNNFNTRLNTFLDKTNFLLPGNDLDHYYPDDVYDIPIDENADNRDFKNRDNVEADDVDSYDKLIGATFIWIPYRIQRTLQQK